MIFNFDIKEKIMPYFKTNEKFLEDLNKVNPNIEPLEQYKNSREKILCKCKVCGYEWKTAPFCLLCMKTGCPKCATKRNKDNMLLSREEFISRISPNIEVLGEYQGINHKVLVRCKVCGYEWSPMASSIMRGTGCIKCYHNSMRKENKK
jgi:predicted Zn-ribbon and HTH transcriptional regulator